MTKFETLDNMNTNFVALSDQELMEKEGGTLPIIAPSIIPQPYWFGVLGYFLMKK